MLENIKKIILDGDATLGIELGSTRIKAVLISPDNTVIASGSHQWENQLTEGFWSYSLDDVWAGIRNSFKDLSENVNQKYDVYIKKINAIGISAMMHGYLAFDSDDNLLTPFRTWRNTTTEHASKELTSLFDFNIPLRWSIAHLYQAILDKEPHISKVSFITTLAGYVHYKLTGQRVLGIGDASGVFPIDINTKNYCTNNINQFNELLKKENISWKLENILPTVLEAGINGGVLTDVGANLLDPTGNLESGVLMCPPEGDAGTGMVATNSIDKHTGNVSAGTSVFAMIVLDKNLKKVYPEIDIVTTPDGKPVAMVHCNNCTSDLDAWINLFKENIEIMGFKIDNNTLYEKLLLSAEKGDTSGLLAYNYYSGEPITNLEEGRPILIRLPNSNFTVANLMKTHLYSSVATLKMGMDILFNNEDITITRLLGHGGFFKTTQVGQKVMSCAMGVPVAVMETAGEGGAWGIAVLASYMKNKLPNQTLDSYLCHVFSNTKIKIIEPTTANINDFQMFYESFQKGLVIEKCSIDAFK